MIAAIIGDIVLFLIRRLHRWFLQTDLLELSFSIQVISVALQLKCVCVTSFFLLLGQLRGLPYQKNNFLSHLMKFNFYKHLLVEDQLCASK